MKFKILSVASLITLFIFTLNMQSQLITGQSSPVLLKGKVIDELTGQPAGVNIEIRNSDGKKIKINSNSLHGDYEQLLESNQTYEFIFTGYDIIRKSETVKTLDTAKYAEQEINFSVKKLTPGVTFQNVDAFEKLSLNPSNNLVTTFDEIKDIMKFNRAVSFEFYVNAHDTYIKAPDPAPIVVDKKPKKKKAKQVKQAPQEVRQQDPDPELIKKLVDTRYDVINKLLSDESWKRYSKRISLVKDYSLGELPSNSGSVSPNHDFKVVVSALDTNMTK